MRSATVGIAFVAGALVFGGVAFGQAPVFGPCPLPSWADQAQTKLGWVFADPTDPGASAPLTGWETYVGSPPAPAWDYDAARIVWSAPGQWHIQIPNVEDLSGHKEFWLCYVYERDNYYGGNYIFRNMEWTPFDSEQNVTMNEELFDATGAATGNPYLGVYGRLLYTGDLYPCPASEDIWLGLVGSATTTPDGDLVWELLEVYLMARPAGAEVFSDGFETGNTSAWSVVVPPPP